jgi:tRNA pseudouridine-54 N-methylase
MRKEIYLALGLSVAGAINAHFNGRTEQPKKVVKVAQNSERVQIKPEEMPGPVKKALAEDKYKAWEIQSVYKVKTTIEYYEVVLKKETDTKTIKLDQNGKAIEEVK